MFKKIRYLTVGSVIACQSIAVNAQDATNDMENPSFTLEEIIVTATKREQSLQDVSVAVSSLSGLELENSGVQGATGINKLVPGVQIQTGGAGGVSLFIRGVGSTAANANGDPGNAFSIDQVYFSRPIGPDVVLFDIARLEVLKGPQGTLYGRNATGGAFSVISNKPDIDEGLTGNFSLEGGDYGLFRSAGAINIPLTDDAAMRIAYQTLDRGGYFDDGYSDADTDAIRAQFYIEPTDTFSALFSVDYAEQGGQGAGYVPRGPGNSDDFNGGAQFEYVNDNPWAGPSSAATQQFVQDAAAGPVNINGSWFCDVGARCDYVATNGNVGDGYVDNSIYGAALTLDWELGFADATAILGYRGTKQDTKGYRGPIGEIIESEVDQYSFEARLSSVGEKLDWVAGVFYLEEEQDFSGLFDSGGVIIETTDVDSSPFIPVSCVALGLNPGCTSAFLVLGSFALDWSSVNDETWAIFGDASYSLTDTTRLNVGLRYSEERKANTDGLFNVSLLASPGALYEQYDSSGALKFDSVDYRLALEHDINDESMLYVSVSSAFHAGGLNTGASEGPTDSTYEPEEIVAYALGSKNRFLNNTLELNLEAFYWDYTDLQVQHIGSINSGLADNPFTPFPEDTTISLRTDTAGSAYIAGIDLEMKYQLSETDLLMAKVLVADSEYEEFSVADAEGGSFDASGNNLSGVASWTSTLGYTHFFYFDNGGSVAASLRSNYTSGTWMSFDHSDKGNYQEGYSQSDVSLTYTALDEVWSISAYVRNLEDEATMVSKNLTEDTVTALPWTTLNAPRTTGVTVQLSF